MRSTRQSSQESALRWFTDPQLLQVSSVVDARESKSSQILGAALALDRFEHLAGRSASTVLDAGCGPGSMLKELKSYGVQACLGFDPSPDAVKQASEIFGVNCWEGAAEDEQTYDHLKSKVDVAIVHLTLGLWSDPLKGLRNLVNSMADTSLIYVMDISNAGNRLLENVADPYERQYLSDQIAGSLAPEEFNSILRKAAPNCKVEVGTGFIGGFNPPDPRAMMLIGGLRTRSALLKLSQMSEGTSPPGCFLTGWIMKKGGENNEDSLSE